MGLSFFLILGITAWIAVALWPAFIAKSKGYNFWLFFLISVFFSIIIALLVALLLHDKNETAEDKADEIAADEALEAEEDRA